MLYLVRNIDFYMLISTCWPITQVCISNQHSLGSNWKLNKKFMWHWLIGKKYNQNYLENNDCVTCVFMVLFPNQRLLFWSEEFVPRGAARGTIPNDQNNNRRFPIKTMKTNVTKSLLSFITEKKMNFWPKSSTWLWYDENNGVYTS